MDEYQQGDRVRSTGGFDYGHIERLAPRLNEEGAYVQWEGNPFSEWVPATQLERMAGGHAR